TSACYIGRGRYYRGTESRSRSRRTCLVWEGETRERLIAASDVNSGRHNYCRAGTKVRRLSVFLGKSALNETNESSEQMFQVEELIVHEGYDNSKGSFDHDIALLRLKGHGQCAKETKSVRTVCLPPPGQRLQSGIQCEVAGYGKEQQGLWYNSQYLRQAKVLLMSHSVCRDKDYYGSLVTGNMFCAGRPDWSQDACEGDSGGPLVCEAGGRLYLFGIVSWGEGCAKEFRPGVYTMVTNYNHWIAAKTGMSSITAGSMASMAPPK
ncbi:hypothetical protein CRUP_033268, partial [Coryphaenoides rupestris]